MMMMAMILPALLIRCHWSVKFSQDFTGGISGFYLLWLRMSMWKEMWRMVSSLTSRLMKMKMRMEEARGESFSEVRSNHAAAVESGPRAKDAKLPAPK